MDSFYQDLANWFQTPLGRYVATTEQQQIAPMLPHLALARYLQIGQWHHSSLLTSQPQGRNYQLHLTTPKVFMPQDELIHVCADADALPFYAQQINVCITPHVLEFAPNPRQVLREIDRVLVDDGYLLLAGFNPLSLWGIRRLFNNDMPFCGQFLSYFRVKEWLNVLGFEIIQLQQSVFNLPLQNHWLRHYGRFLDHYGQRWHWQSGGVYILLAQKRRYPLTPVSKKISYQPIWAQT